MIIIETIGALLAVLVACFVAAVSLEVRRGRRETMAFKRREFVDNEVAPHIIRDESVMSARSKKLKTKTTNLGAAGPGIFTTLPGHPNDPDN